MAGAGTAPAAGAVGSGSRTSRPAAVSHTAAVGKNATTVLYGFDNGGTVPVELGGLDSTMARALLAKAGITLGRTAAQSATAPHPWVFPATGRLSRRPGRRRRPEKCGR